MASNGTPQSYLYQQRGQSDQYRDRSMEQSNTNSGNPYNQGPPDNRYIPPSFNPNTGQWNTAGQQYMTPAAYSGYTGQYDMQRPNQYMPWMNQQPQPTQQPAQAFMPQKPGVASAAPPPSTPTQVPAPTAQSTAGAAPMAGGLGVNQGFLPQTGTQINPQIAQQLQELSARIGNSGGISQGMARYLPYLNR